MWTGNRLPPSNSLNNKLLPRRFSLGGNGLLTRMWYTQNVGFRCTTLFTKQFSQFFRGLCIIQQRLICFELKNITYLLTYFLYPNFWNEKSVALPEARCPRSFDPQDVDVRCVSALVYERWHGIHNVFQSHNRFKRKDKIKSVCY